MTLLATTSVSGCGKPADAPASANPPEHLTASDAPAITVKPGLVRGQQVYRQSCAFCHDKGVAGAPKIADSHAWGPRLAQGLSALYAAALHGKGDMPAKGGNPSLADNDVKSAVDYLSAQAR